RSPRSPVALHSAFALPSASTGHIANADRSSSSALPALGQHPRPRPKHDHRIVPLADRPHPRPPIQLFRVCKQHTGRERIDEPRTREPLLILFVLPPI